MNHLARACKSTKKKGAVNRVKEEDDSENELLHRIIVAKIDGNVNRNNLIANVMIQGHPKIKNQMIFFENFLIFFVAEEESLMVVR